jgi:hypothetical protein
MAKVKKPKRLPRGVGRVPEWWLEMTPHETLILEEEEAKRIADQEEELKFAQLAAEQDWLQKYGGEGFPDWDPSKDGPRTPEEEKEWIGTGYQRSETTGEWTGVSGEPLEGRKFKGKLPSGYVPGEFRLPGSTKAADGRPLKSVGGRYGRDDGKNWEQPSWTKVKLKKTDAGRAYRNGTDDKSPKKGIVKSTGAVAKTKMPAAPALDDAPAKKEEAPVPAKEEEAPAAAKEEEEASAKEKEAPKEAETEKGPSGIGKLIKRVHRSTRVIKRPSTKEGADEGAEEEFEEEIVEEHEEYEEEIVESDEEIIEEIIVEDEDGNEIYE